MTSLHHKPLIQRKKATVPHSSPSHYPHAKQSISSKAATAQREAHDRLDSAPIYDLQGRLLEEGIQKSDPSCQNYFLRKTILVLYKFFQRMERRWNLSQLNYRQMTIILKELRYIKHIEGDSGAENSEQLKKCYYLWINLVEDRFVSLSNLMIILCHIQHLDIDVDLVGEVVAELQKGINKFQPERISQGDPNFIFLVKKECWNLRDNKLSLDQKQVRQLQKQLASFRYTRLTENQPKIDLQQDYRQEPQIQFMSKKSVELAGHKRQKILEEIRLKQSNVETIQLHHILNYRQANARLIDSKIREDQPNHPTIMSKNPKQKTPKATKQNPTKNSFSKKANSRKKNSPIEKQNVNKNGENRREKSDKQRQSKQQLGDTFGDDLGLSEIVKTQIIEDIEWTDTPQDDSQTNSLLSCPEKERDLGILPQSLVYKQCDNQKEKKRRQYIDIPILYVDVNIEEGKKERIVVYQGDTAAELAAEFGKKHNLGEEMIERLVGMLKQQIGSVLTKIDEAAEEDCSYLY